MKSSDYWAKRFNQIEQSQHDRGAAAQAEIERQYRTAQKSLESKIAVWYQRLAANNGVSLQEAKKMLTDKELEEFKWGVEEYIKYGQENALNGEWMQELENASARYHISRLEALKLQCQQDVEVLFGNQLDTLDRTMRDVYTYGYYHAAFEIQKGVGVGWSFSALDTRKIDKVINTPWATDGSNFSDRVWTNKEKLVNQLNTTLTQNIITGQDPQKAINQISKQLDVSKSTAGRLVMTEEAYFASEAQKDCYKELDVEQYEIVATLDSITSEICRSMDGRVFKISEWEVGVTAPPFHPWCRTVTAPHYDEDFDESVRVARSADGKEYTVPAGTTYREWEKEHVQDADNSVANSSSASYNRDKEQYDRYKNVLGDLAPESFEDFQSVKYSDSAAYGTLKHQYRALNAYETNFGQMDGLKKVELYDKTLETKNLFTGSARKRSNTAVMELDGEIKIANSTVCAPESPAYSNFKGDKSQIVFPPTETKFTAKIIGSHLRDTDSEKTLLEYAATVAEDGKPHTVNLFSERCMCESCRGVVEQFQIAYPNVSISAVSARADRVKANKNDPMKYLGGKKR